MINFKQLYLFNNWIHIIIFLHQYTLVISGNSATFTSVISSFKILAFQVQFKNFISVTRNHKQIKADNRNS